MKGACFTISAKNPLRYIAAALALGATFFTLFAIEPTWSTDYAAHSIFPQENPPDGYELILHHREGISVSSVICIIAEALFIALCLSSFISKRPWLLTVPMALTAAVPIISGIEHGFGINYGFVTELGLIALFALTAAGIIRTKLPAVIVLSLYAGLYLITVVRFGITGINGDLWVMPLMWLGYLLIAVSLKRTEGKHKN